MKGMFGEINIVVEGSMAPFSARNTLEKLRRLPRGFPLASRLD